MHSLGQGHMQAQGMHPNMRTNQILDQQQQQQQQVQQQFLRQQALRVGLLFYCLTNVSSNKCIIITNTNWGGEVLSLTVCCYKLFFLSCVICTNSLLMLSVYISIILLVLLLGY